MSEKPLILGTRGSDLALAQANMTAAALTEALGEGTVEIRVIRTIGDKRPDLKLSEFSQGDSPVVDKGIFTKELEEALIAGEIDFAVHSLKDVPTELGDGFEIVATLPRAPIEDVLLSRKKLEGIPRTGTIATSSVRRARMLLHRSPDLDVVDIRGNVPTRIKKLIENPEWDAIVLARAGLLRLGLLDESTGLVTIPEGQVHAQILDPQEEFLPAAGQGAVAMEIRSENTRAREALATINDLPTFQRVTLERAFLARLKAGCQTPVGAHTTFTETGEIHIQVAIFPEDDPAAAPREATATGSPTDPEAIVDQLMG